MALTPMKKAKNGGLKIDECNRTDLNPGRYSDGRNLYLYVSPTGAKSWSFVWQQNGTQREMGLGSYTGAGASGSVPVDIAKARSLAQEVRDQLAMGIDPVKARKAARVADKVSSLTFADVLKDVLDIQKREWTPEADGTYLQEQKWVRSLQQHAPRLAGRPADEKKGLKAIPSKRVALVTDEDVLAVLKPIWSTKEQTASRLMYRISKVMERAIKKGWHPGPNPARYEDHIKDELGTKASKAATKEGGHLAMHFDDMPAFWPQLIVGTTMATKALAFTILTAVRTDEARLAEWSEINWEKREWVVPAERMKGTKGNRKPHAVPLSTQAIALLRSIKQQPGNPFIFAGKKKSEAICCTALKDRLVHPAALGGLGMQGKATVHGFRKTFRSWASKQGYSDKACEMCLAHVFGTAVQRVYDLYDMIEVRAEIMQAWADYATSQVAPKLKLVA